MQVREITPRQQLTPAERAMPITPDAHNMSLSRRFKVVRADPGKRVFPKNTTGRLNAFFLAKLVETGDELYISRHCEVIKSSGVSHVNNFILMFYTSLDNFKEDESVFQKADIKTLGDLQAAMYDAFSRAFMLREVSKKRKAPEPPCKGVPPPPVPPDH